MIPWQSIDTVLLDMDGTLLDLHFDQHFWLEHLPRRYAERHGIALDAAKAELMPRLERIQGTLDWYCLDYWSRELDLDVARLKLEIGHLIAARPETGAFLRAAAGGGRRVVLVTNAHAASLELKLARTGLTPHFDAIVCSHALGAPKEQAEFWDRLQAEEPFDPARALFVDDSLPVLRAARAHGVAHLRAVRRPDSRGPARDTGEFESVDSLLELLPA